MSDSLRHVKLSSGHTLQVWDAGERSYSGHVKSTLRYEFRALRPSGTHDTLRPPIFEGADFGCSPLYAIDSDAALLALLGFLTLRPGDTDPEYFEDYTPAQREWSESDACESLHCEVSTAEEAVGRDGCACAMWENLDGHECPERGNVVDFQVLDHGEDGPQYFPGCGVHGTPFEYVVTGAGDTGAEAFEDALEQMATDEPEAHPSALQEVFMRDYLSDPDRSAFESLDHSQCGEDHSGDDWQHYVSIRYNVRGD